jgi:hypothetical protein
MTLSEKAEFFEDNHISIQVSLKAPEQEQEEIEERKKLGAAYMKVRDVVDVLGYLGDSFAAGAKKDTVELCLPKDPDAPTGLVNKEYLEIDNFEPSWKGMKLDVDPFSPNIVLPDRLSEFLNKCKSID